MANKLQEGDRSADKWLDIWKTEDKPGWHMTEVDIYLQKYHSRLVQDKPRSSILVTWCGKSMDLIWLVEQGHTVVGVELSEVAVKQFFQENDLSVSMSERDGFKVYTADDKNITIYCGNMYELNPSITGCRFDAIWDHMALGANSPADRSKHIDVLHSSLKPNGRLLLSSFEYDPSLHSDAPFSLSSSLIQDLFKEHFHVELLESADFNNSSTAQRFKLTWLNRLIHIVESTS